MRIVSVNAGKASTLLLGTREWLTGIDKRQVDGRVRIDEQGVEHDEICNTEHHGGIDQAAYAYGVGDYAWWSDKLDRKLLPGTFGENLTIDGLPSDMHVGDRLLIGDVILEATAPRIPCSTFAARMQDEGFGLEFRHAERPGVYFRVLNAGHIQAGDAVTLVEDDTSAVSILELFRLAYELAPTSERLRRCLDAPISQRLRAKLEARLAAEPADD